MFSELKQNITLYTQLQEVETYLGTLRAALTKKRKLLDSLLPWIEDKREEIEKTENGFNFRFFGNKEEQLEQIREEYHKMILRANGMQDEIELMEYEEKVLKEKRFQIPSVVYAFEKMARETDLKTLDKKSRKILSGIKKCKKKQDEITGKLKEAGIAADYAWEIEDRINRLIALLRNSGDANQHDPIFGAMEMNLFSKETNRRKSIELGGEIAHKIELLSMVASKGELIFDRNRTLAKIHGEDLIRPLRGHFTNFKLFHAIKVFIETQQKIKRRREELTLITNELKLMKASLETEKHNLMLGNVS